MIRTCLALSLFASLGLAGCGGSGHPTTYAATGIVLYKDQPVASAEVIFTPVAAEPARPARGTTDSQGRFQLHTYFSPTADAPGALPGDYSVTITKIAANERVVGTENITPPKNELPLKYASRDTSELKATVSSSGSSPAEFKLVD